MRPTRDKWPTKVLADSVSVCEKLRMDLSQRILVLFQNDKHFRLGGKKLLKEFNMTISAIASGCGPT